MKKIIVESLYIFSKPGRIAGRVLFLCISLALLASCATTVVTNEKMFAEVIGFNDNIMQSYMPPSKSVKETDILRPIPEITANGGNPYNLQDSSHADYLKNAIDILPEGQNTAALYALDIGLDRVEVINQKFMEQDPDSRYYVVFFTDCLDNISVDMAIRTKRGNYPRGVAGRIAYGNEMQKRMSEIIKLSNKPSATNLFQSYVFLLDNDDLRSYPDEIVESLYTPFLASQNAQRPEVIKGDDPSKIFEEFEKVFPGSYISSFMFNVPKDYVNQRIHMQLSEDVYFEATLRLQIKRSLFSKRSVYTLENIITSEGFSFNENIQISMDASFDDRLSTVPFTINNLMLNDKSYPVNQEIVTQQHFAEDADRFVINSEYSGRAINTKNTYVLFIIDTSLSVRGLETARETAKLIIDFMINEP